MIFSKGAPPPQLSFVLLGGDDYNRRADRRSDVSGAAVIGEENSAEPEKLRQQPQRYSAAQICNSPGGWDPSFISGRFSD